MKLRHQTASNYSGLGLIGLSFLLFIISLNSDKSIQLFWINHFITLWFFVTTLLVKPKGTSFWLNLFKSTNATYSIILFSISAFALNQFMHVFDDSVIWLCIVLMTAASVIIFYTLFETSNKYLLSAISFVLGVATLVYTYFSLILVGLYPAGLIGTIVLGLSLHVFAPLLMLYTAIRIVKEIYLFNSQTILYYLIGISVPLLFTIIWVSIWFSRIERINDTLSLNNIYGDTSLPAWVKTGQQLIPDQMTVKILKSGLLYRVFDDNPGFFSMPDNLTGEPKRHDPLIVVSTLFAPSEKMQREDNIQLLKVLSRNRHQTQEKLWNGDALSVNRVTSNIRIYPELQLAYTEKTISIHSNNEQRFQNEAIFTFHLPEGSVVTSLSLWINGKEEKGILTTSAKADSAYKTIVGVEQRDPSIVKWQEGNTVTVRVFPCTSEEDRLVKIGITSPLPVKNNKVYYENTWFEGPENKSAKEIVKLQFMRKPEELILPESFEQESQNSYSSTTNYQPDWELNFKKQDIITNSFTFNNFTYQIKPLTPQIIEFKPTAIYLDVNASWSPSDFSTALKIFLRKDVYVYDEKFIKVTAQNRDQLYEKLSKLTFSLFPIYKIKDPATTLIVSSSTPYCPTLDELKSSSFYENLKNYSFQQTTPINVVEIGSNESLYLQALKEMRLVNAIKQDWETLSIMAGKEQFNTYPETDSSIVVKNANLRIERIAATNQPNNAPDHLLRLFAYNHLLYKIGHRGLENDYVNDDLIEEASIANIISPVSSLVVLETQQDYDRFGINQNENGLGNASMNNSGAVPEPHEWMLIALIAGGFIYIIYQKIRNKFTYNL